MNIYRKSAEEIIRRGDTIIAEKRRRSAVIRRTAFAVSGLCAALVLGIGVWNSSSLKGALTPDPDHGYADIIDTRPTSTTTAETVTTTTTASTSQRTASTQLTEAVTTHTTSTTQVTSAASNTTAATAVHTTVSKVTTVVTNTEPETTAAVTTPTEPNVTPVSPEHPVDTPERWEDLPINERFSRFEMRSSMESYSPETIVDVYTSTGETMSDENIVRFIGMTPLTAVDPDTGITHEATAECFITREFNVCALRFPDDENYYIYELTNTRTEVPDPKEGIL